MLSLCLPVPPEYLPTELLPVSQAPACALAPVISTQGQHFMFVIAELHVLLACSSSLGRSL